MHRVNAFGNSLGVCRKLAEGIGSLAGWRKGVRQMKIETRRKIVGVGSRRKFARRFVERIGKLAGNAKGDRRKEDRRTCRKIAGGCRNPLLGLVELRVELNQLTKELVNVKVKPEFEKWREPLLRKF
ncbi:hypothetical protein BHE74_00035808 [Ensete ventricosum]|nr:hypothetical protein BHE74_00035808 [Ensete ventricosum]